jgi:hypothetical protein
MKTRFPAQGSVLGAVFIYALTKRCHQPEVILTSPAALGQVHDRAVPPCKEEMFASAANALADRA